MTTVIVRDAYDLRREVDDAIARFSARLPFGAKVFLKPNLTYPRHLPGVTTSPEFVAIVAESMLQAGLRPSVGESDGGYGAWSAELAFEGHGLRRICGKLGIPLVNLSHDDTVDVRFNWGTSQSSIPLPRTLLEADVTISLPVPKVHAVTIYSGAVKNQWGCIPDAMRIKRHPQFVELIAFINHWLKDPLVLSDARFILDRSGPLAGDPVYMNRFIASDDVAAFDDYVVEHVMGLSPASVRYLSAVKSEYDVDDMATGPRHQFSVQPSLRHRLVRYAFPRQWAVNLLWDSWFGNVAHRALYAISGNPVEVDRIATENSIAASRR